MNFINRTLSVYGGTAYNADKVKLKRRLDAIVNKAQRVIDNSASQGFNKI